MTRTLDERFFAKVHMTSDCWEWTGARSSTGYGVVSIASRDRGTHRVAYEQMVGTIPAGLCIDHLCRNRACVRPDHLEVVTAATNNLRGESPYAKNKRKTHCKHGHPLSGENLYLNPRGERQCRVCQKDRERRYRQNSPEKARARYRRWIQKRGGRRSSG